jgi:SAM-dependent methyltransferase
VVRRARRRADVHAPPDPRLSIRAAADVVPLLGLLECPSCRAGALAQGDAGLDCRRCGATFPIRDGVGCFQRLFDDYSHNYDEICADDLREPKTPTAVKAVLATLVRERARGVVCDLGCGDGYVLTRLDASARIAVDIALGYLDRLPGSILRLWSRVEDVPLRTGAVDTVVCTDVLEHVQDAAALAREIERLLPPGGQALLAFPFEQDLGVYELSEYRRKYAKYRFVHLRSVDDNLLRRLFPEFELRFEHLITEGMAAMEFKPYPIKFVQLVRG